MNYELSAFNPTILTHINQSIAKIRPIYVVGIPTASRHKMVYDNPALGIPEAPADTNIAIKLYRIYE